MADEIKNLTTARQKFVASLKTKKRSISTILAYDNDIKQLTDFLLARKITQVTTVTPEFLEEFKKSLFDNKYSAKSVSRKLNSFKTFFRFLKAQGVIGKDPAEAVSHPKLDAKPPRIFSKMEYRALRDAARDNLRLSAIIELLLQTGLKIGELGRLELSDITDKEILIKPYESNQTRTVPLNHAAKAALDHYLAARTGAKTKCVFITKHGRPFLVRNIRTAIERYFRLAGISNANINSLRHTFIVQQLASGVPVNLVQKLVGHKRLSTTEKYLPYAEIKGEKSVKLEEL